jgi:hypothetical protein
MKPRTIKKRDVSLEAKKVLKESSLRKEYHRQSYKKLEQEKRARLKKAYQGNFKRSQTLELLIKTNSSKKFDGGYNKEFRKVCVKEHLRKVRKS